MVEAEETVVTEETMEPVVCGYCGDCGDCGDCEQAYVFSNQKPCWLRSCTVGNCWTSHNHSQELFGLSPSGERGRVL